MSAQCVTPRLVIGGVSSGVGKTTVTVGLARALAARGLTVRVFKAGPDYLDPTYHQRASGAICHNLDSWMMGRSGVLETFASARDADIALVEGVMGLFDGVTPTATMGSTAELAHWLHAPVLLVADVGGMARSLAALVRGFDGFDGTEIAGVIANRCGSRGHFDLLCKALSRPPILGGLPKAPEHRFPERHLGLRTADEAIDDNLLETWGSHANEWIDLDRVLALARQAAPLPALAATSTNQPRRCRIGIAWDEAFHFYYEFNLRALERAGAELVRFSPLSDSSLPEVDGLYLGGGYPEVHAEALAGNRAMLDDIARFGRERPIYAECGGLMLLGEQLVTIDGSRHRMVGLLPTTAVVQNKLQALGYVEVETQQPSILGPAGIRFRGHQFRYSTIERAENAPPIYSVRKRRGGSTSRQGFSARRVVASYIHAHWASNPLIPRQLVAACS